MWDWLISPVDPARIHDVGFHLSWHARLMVLAWGVLVPVGILSARFFKVLPRQQWPLALDNRRWWHTHRICQYSAVVLMGFAVYTIFQAPMIVHSGGPHRVLGWITLGLAGVQVSSALLRGSMGGPTHPARDGSFFGDHYYMTPRRLAFEIIHKTVGYAALLMSVATILTGLWQANAPRWMFVAMLAIWAMIAAAFWLFEKRGMVVDTYQAIWGPDPSLPGNAKRRSHGGR